MMELFKKECVFMLNFVVYLFRYDFIDIRLVNSILVFFLLDVYFEFSK